MNRESPKRQPDQVSQSPDSLSLSNMRKVEQEIHDDFVSIRHTTTRIDDRDALIGLILVAKHPKLPQHERAFDLSHLLQEADRILPETLEMVIKPDLAMEDRLTAIRIILDRLEADRAVSPTSDRTMTTTPSEEIQDELESSLSIESGLFTSLVDALSGTSVRGVTVLRNGEPFLQFRVTESPPSQASATLLVVPTALELPLLDREGHPVQADTADEALHDFTHLLYSQRHAHPERLLMALGRNLAARQRLVLTDPREPSAVQYCLRLLLAANEMDLFLARESALSVSPSLAPQGSLFFPRSLPDGRVMWTTHEERAPAAHHVRMVGNSTVGEPYSVDLQFSPYTFSKVRLAFHKLFRDEEVWPSFHELCGILARDYSSKASLDYPGESSSYPVSVNSLILSLEGKGLASCLRGSVPEHVTSDATLLPRCVTELVRGRVPVHLNIKGACPATTWSVQCFFDEELGGEIFMRNRMSGRIVLSTIVSPLSASERKAEILRVFEDLTQRGMSVLQEERLSPDFEERRANLPRGTRGDQLSYEVANHAAALCLNTIQSVGYSRLVSDPSWIVKHAGDERWSVTLPTLFSVDRALPYLINMQVGPEGVWEVSYSRGQRGPLGWLFGRRILSGVNNQGFSDKELENIIALICSEEGKQDPMREFQDLTAIRSGMTVLPFAPLREVDPEALQRDTIARLWNGLKSLRPFSRSPQPEFDY